jgi:hypothetical protein
VLEDPPVDALVLAALVVLAALDVPLDALELPPAPDVVADVLACPPDPEGAPP